MHFAEVQNGIVLRVIVADQDFVDSHPTAGTWIQTSYNTRGGVHYGADGLPDGGVALRKNFAGVGFTYDLALDAFIPPKPYPSWQLDPASGLWNAPVPMPQDGEQYVWDEDSKQWINDAHGA